VIVYYYMKNLSWILVCNFAAIVCFEKIKESQNSVEAQIGSHEIRLEIHLSKNWRTNHLVTEKLCHQYKCKGDSFTVSIWNNMLLHSFLSIFLKYLMWDYLYISIFSIPLYSNYISSSPSHSAYNLHGQVLQIHTSFSLVYKRQMASFMLLATIICWPLGLREIELWIKPTLN
jgi:hypothetical protein